MASVAAAFMLVIPVTDQIVTALDPAPASAQALAPVITSLTQDQTVTAVKGERVTFSVTATGARSYKWQIDQGKGWEEIDSGTGYNTATFTTTPRDVARDHGKKYRVLVTNAAGTTTSPTITLLMTTATATGPVITTPTANQQVTGTAGKTVTLSVKATGATTYKWQIDQGKGWEEIDSGTGYNTATFTTSPRDVARDHGKKYRVLVSNAAGTTTSPIYTLSMHVTPPAPVAPDPKPAITTPTANQQVTGTAGKTVTLSVKATGATTYKWQIDQGKGWEDIDSGTGYNTATFTTSPRDAARDHGKKYRVLVSNAAGTTTSPIYTLSMGSPAPTTPPPGQDPAPVPSGGVLVNATFNGMPSKGFGQLSNADMTAAFGLKTECYSRGEMAIADGAMRVRFAPNNVGSARAYCKTFLPKGHDELWMRYRVYAESGWEAVKGGKLPGFAGGAGNTGQNKPTKGEGFSARNMWRGGGDLVQYVYHKNQARSYADDLKYSQPAKIRPGQWVTITHHVKMNKPGQRNGTIAAYVDGRQVLNQTNLELRGAGYNFGIDQLLVGGFYGGNDRSWGPSKTTYMRFDDVVVSTNRLS